MVIKFEKLDNVPDLDPRVTVKCVEMGNIVEVQYMSRKNKKQTVKMLKGGNEFVVCATGEVKEVVHGTSRHDNKKGLYKTFARARALINTNVTDVSKVRWCTLTYAENMTDTTRLYQDFEKFNKRFQYYCKKLDYGKPEYIVMMEPQGRGAWHAHLLYIWQDRQAPFIPNDVFASLWGHGFVKIKRLDDVDNVGAYLTAYLGDMELSECEEITPGMQGKVVEMEEHGKKVKKKFIKGARLDLYPANFNMIRYSRGCKQPTVEMIKQRDVRKKVLGATKTFQSAVQLSDTEHDFQSVIIKEQYNRARKTNQ